MLKAKTNINAEKVKYLVTPPNNKLLCLLNRNLIFINYIRKNLEFDLQLFLCSLISVSRTIQVLTKYFKK